MNKKTLNIVWWNANNLFHFDSKKKGKNRWPANEDYYKAKCQRVDDAISEIRKQYQKIDILCLCEITKKAAEELRDRLFPGFGVISLDVKSDEPTLQVAMIFPPDSDYVKYQEQLPIVVPNVPSGTRPMAVLEIMIGKHRLRVIACHWQARIDEDGSDRGRFRSADFLSTYSFDFISQDQDFHDIVIVGDLNEEPYEPNLGVLNAHRHRGRSLKKFHWTDHNVKRVHLYNSSWRLLGEKHPITSPEILHGSEHSAGTYYWEAKHTWHHFDHAIVSGGLLRDKIPFLDEGEACILSLPSLLTEGFPIKFSCENGKYSGLSDHLPIFLKINI
ncbi:endonuclease/exonuclease/phosphatase family protein [Janthinobacterium lividum]|uniref:endonuclease/exonuclease/phosphatase family protein n=1 Tax=Janthinobacterium lividum TaxID=29581 RepID=UPI00140C3B97|nr:hypothetical protein [Janthinobacterium lividum]